MPDYRPAAPPSRRRLFIGCLGAACVTVVLVLALRAKVRGDAQRGLRLLGRALLIASIREMLGDDEMPQEEAAAALDVLVAGLGSCEHDEGKEDQFADAAGAIILAYWIEARYLPRSGLPEQRNAKGRLVATRFARAASSIRIPNETLDDVFCLVAVDLQMDVDGEHGGDRLLRPTLSDEELRGVLEKMKAIADDCGIVDVAPGIDLAAEIERAAERVCGTRAVETAPDR